MTTEMIKPKIGRPTKLTPELQEKICKYIAEGNYLSVACAAVDVSDQTYHTWLKLGEEEVNNGGGMFADFLEGTKKAEAEQEAKIAERLLAGAMPGERKRVTKTGPEGSSIEITETGGDWLAAATYLERRHPDRWGRRDRTRIDINETREITITHVEYNLAGVPPGQIIEGESHEIAEDSSPLSETIKRIKESEPK